jgi:hypothetical protein
MTQLELPLTALRPDPYTAASMPTRRVFLGQLLCAVAAARAAPVAQPAPPQEISGVYPSLAMFNDERECGTGAVVAWAGRLWAITYGPHLVQESSDRLYEITPDLRQIVRPESVGGTNANRLIHRESQQLFIGPYAIDASARVRVIARSTMPGRLTGTARHLTHPDARVYFATMEEGLYEVDVGSLAVTGLLKDGNGGVTSPERPASIESSLPGYHGKGLYTGQGRLVYANNGEAGAPAQRDPRTTSGALAEWRGAGDWSMVRRNQFTEVTGPGGIEGARAESDPIWSIGWDHRSLILMVLDGGAWSTYRLPKASHSYDGAHGWNTEWPRIREIGDGDALMTMHGMMWRFPVTFSRQRSGGIVPRSTYLKVVGDFCRWRDRVVFGCDDTAAAEFLNVRRAKGKIAGPGQSQSNLWFVPPSRLDRLGPAAGSGAVWTDEALEAGAISDPFLFDGFARRALHLAHAAGATVSFVFEVDRDGRDRWEPLRSIDVPPSGYRWVDFTDVEPAAWVRVRLLRAAAGVTALFTLANADRRSATASSIFDGLARTTDKSVTGGLLHARGEGRRTLGVSVDRGTAAGVVPAGYYELDERLRLAPAGAPHGKDDAWIRANVAIPRDVVVIEPSSVLVVDDAGRRWRLPRDEAAFDAPGAIGPERVDREVCTERDLFNCHGTFYELPAENAGGFARIRPVTTHNRRVHDYCSYRGLLVMTGIADDAQSARIVRSADGRAAVWVGVVDDLWELGRPRGTGGPWLETPVSPGVNSDPYLMTGYERKTLALRHDRPASVGIDAQIDVSGDGLWHTYRRFEVPPGEGLTYRFPDAFTAYWIRFVTTNECLATALLTYE